MFCDKDLVAFLWELSVLLWCPAAEALPSRKGRLAKGPRQPCGDEMEESR